MPFGRRPKLTGPDYLLGVAQEASDRGQPYASHFANMVFSAFSGENLLIGEVIARRPLEEHEASPVAIIFGALQAAEDPKSTQEVLRVGLTLLAKWPDYLCSQADGHPKLQWKPMEGQLEPPAK